MENRTRVILIGAHCKGYKRHKINAITLLQRTQVGISEADSQHICQAGLAAARRTHPNHIVVAPLNVIVMIVAEPVQNLVSRRPPVVDISHNMQRIYGKTLNHIAYCNNKVLCAPCRDNGLYNGCNILLLIVTAAPLGLVQQLLNNIGILIWQGLPYLRPGILGRDHSAHTHKMAQHCLVPLIQILALLLY